MSSVPRALIVLLFGLLAFVVPGLAQAQAAIAAAEIDTEQLPPVERLTLRPSEGLEALAAKVARVLTLRTGTVVDVGDAPPPGVLEAVPAGHIALAREGGHVRLVLGAALGRSFEANVQLADGQGESDVRSMALAVETLRDRALEAHARLVEAEALAAEPAAAATEQAPLTAAPPAAPSESSAWPIARDQAEREPHAAYEDRRLRPVQPMFYLRAYSGASSESTAPRVGVGAGGGLCVLGHCLVLTLEYPMPIASEHGGDDIRYRYTTFT